MTAGKNMSAEEIERRLLAEASDPDSWEHVTTVSASRSPRPAWYPQTARRERTTPPTSHGESRDARFRSLYERYFGRVTRYYVRAYQMPKDDAEDFAQEAFLRLYKVIDEYRGEAEWALLETIARTVAYNRIRALKSASRTAQVVDIAEARAQRAAQAQSAQEYENSRSDVLRRKRLHDAVAELPPGQRAPFQLWLDGFSYAEIARALRISLDAVKSRLRDAKRHLRSRMDEDEAKPAKPRQAVRES